MAWRSLLFVGASDDDERATRYGGLLRAHDRQTSRFLVEYAGAMKPFCFREVGDEHPTGPYCLPPRIVTTVLAEHRSVCAVRLGHCPCLK